MKKNILLCLSIACSSLLLACGDSVSDPGAPGGESGRLFYSGYTAFKIYNLRSGSETSIIDNAAQSHQERYDVTRDGQEIVSYSESLASTDVEFTIYGADGRISSTFSVGQYVNGIPKWSADKSKIAFIWQPASTYPQQYVAIFSRTGQQVRGFKDVVDYAWTSDNRLLMVTANGFYLSSSDLTTAQRVQTLNGLPDTPGQLDISRDDKTVAFVSGPHIWTLNMDGTGLRQVTTSGVREWYPAWSLDNSRLYFGFDRSGNCLELRSVAANKNQPITIDPQSDGDAPRLLSKGNAICSQSQPMLRP